MAKTCAILGAVHSTGSIIIEMGTAVTTINDCKASILPSPILIKITEITPIIMTQNKRINLGGFPSPVTAIEMEYDIESAVVITKTNVKINMANTKTSPKGN